MFLYWVSSDLGKEDETWSEEIYCKFPIERIRLSPWSRDNLT